MPDLSDTIAAGTSLSELLERSKAAGPMPDPEAVRKATELEREAPLVGGFLDEALAHFERRGTGEEKPIPLPWQGVARLLGGGLWPGLGILVGGTGSGKSQWTLQVALHAALQGIPVLYIGLELDRQQLAARLLGLLAGRKWSRIYLGSDRTELAELYTNRAYADRLRQLPIHCEFGPPTGEWTAERLRQRCEAMRARYPLQVDADGQPLPGSRPMLVVLDFLQLVGGDEELRERIGRAAYAGRAVARDLDASVIVVSSTSRENYASVSGAGSSGLEPGKGNAARYVGTGKESGEIEYAADWQATLISMPWGSDSPPTEGTRIWLAIGKVRAGTPGWAELRFDGGRFTEPPLEPSVAILLKFQT